MKSRVNLYFEMPFWLFVKKYPAAAETLRQKLPMFDDFVNDPLYIVRVEKGKIEIGYKDDEWEVH